MSDYFIRVKPVSEFFEVSTPEEFEKMMDRLPYEVIKEVHLVNDAYVVTDKAVCMGNLHARVFLQGKGYAMELLLGDIERIDLKGDDVASEGRDGEFKSLPNSSHRICLSIGTSQFICKRLFYRMEAEWACVPSRYGEEIVLEQLPAITHLEEGWFLCSNCGEAWNAQNRQIHKCPRCSGKEWIESDHLHHV